MPKKYKYTTTFTYDGKRYKVRADSESDLAVKKAMKLRDLEERRVPTSGNLLFKDWAERCIVLYKVNISERSLENYRNYTRLYVVSYLGEMKLKNIRQVDCQGCLNALAGYSQFVINQCYQIMNFMFERAVANGLVYENPAKYCIKPKGDAKVRRSITEDERKVILDLIPTDRRFYMYLLMLGCGCRPSEATSIKGSDIIEIDGHKVLSIKGTKSKNAVRNVPIPKYVYDLIKNTAKDEYVACTSTGNKINEGYQRRVWSRMKREMHIAMGGGLYRSKIVKPSPVADDLVPYCLRHTYCTDLARKKVDIRTAQYLMGHSDISLTANIYTHVDESMVLDAVGVLDGE